MTTLNSFYAQAAAIANPDQRRWALGAAYRIGEYVRFGYSVPAARNLVLGAPQYTNGLTAAGLDDDYALIDDTSADALTFDFYVDPAGVDTNAGTSVSAPFRTLAKAQSVLTAGKSVALKRGGRWKETLTVPTGVTVGAYGPAAITDSVGYITNAPIIDGGEYVTTWTPYAGGIDDSYAKDDISGTAGASITTSTAEIGGPWQTNAAFPSPPLITAAGRARRGAATFSWANLAAPTPNAEYAFECDAFIASSTSGDRTLIGVRCDIGQQSGYFLNVDPFAGTASLVRIRSTVSTTVVTLTRAWTVSSTYRVRIEARTENNFPRITVYIDGVQVHDFTDTSSSFVFAAGQGGVRWGGATAPATGSDTTGVHIKNAAVTPLVTNATPVNTYQATAASTGLVDLRGAYAPNGESMNNLADGQFFWKSSKLYVRSDAGQPTDTDVIAGVRNNAVVCGTGSNITLSGIAVEHTNDQSIPMTGGSGNRLISVMAQRTSSGTGGNGVLGIDGHNNWSVESCIFRDHGSDGVYAQNTTGVTVTASRFGPAYGPNADCVQVVKDGFDIAAYVGGNHFTMTTEINSAKGCVVLQGWNATFENNYCEGANNFGVAPYGRNMIVRGNVFYHHGNGGAVRMRDPASDNVLVHHNVMVDCKTALFVSSSVATPRTNHRYYANTIVNVAVPPDAVFSQVWLDETMSGEFEDNILWNASGSGKAYKVTAVGAAGWVSDYNDLGPESASYINFQGTAYSSLAAYAAAKAKDTHSIIADPLFVNLGGHAESGADYVLQAGSPAIGTGVVVPDIVTVPTMGAK